MKLKHIIATLIAATALALGLASTAQALVAAIMFSLTHVWIMACRSRLTDQSSRFTSGSS